MVVMLGSQELIGPYTIGFAVVMLAGLPVAARYLKRAVRLEAGPLKAELGAVAEHVEQAAKAATIAADAAVVVGESVGDVNGSGSLQKQMSTLMDRLDADEKARNEGQHRQAQIEEAVLSIQSMVMTMRQMLDTHSAWQLAHGEEDMRTFQQLQAACEHLHEVIGDPNGFGDEPLIPYVHRLRHEMANQATRDRMMVELQHKVLTDAMDVMREVRERLDGSDT